MSKEEFFKSLNKDQIEYCQFLIDCAFADGYDTGVREDKWYYGK